MLCARVQEDVSASSRTTDDIMRARDAGREQDAAQSPHWQIQEEHDAVMSMIAWQLRAIGAKDC